MSRRRIASVAVGAIVASAVVAAKAGPVFGPPSGIQVKPSLIVTDPRILTAFPLQRVLEQIAAQSGDPAATATRLFQALFDAQNLAADGFGYPIHCDDSVTPEGVFGLNGFPLNCPRVEGSDAGLDPFVPIKADLYFPAALVNRFDLAPADGAHCGEYRIVYGRRVGGPVFVILEGMLPNPSPASGLEGCRPVAEFWAGLSEPTTDIGPSLEEFFFDGIPGFEPVVHPDHYGVRLGSRYAEAAGGQIRINQFAQPPWTLREFKLVNDCRCSPCQLAVTPVTVKENPYGELFHGDPPALEPSFRAALIRSVPTLAIQDINRFHWADVPDELNAAESENQIRTASDYQAQFAQSTGGPGSLSAEIAAELNRIGSSLWPIHIVRRAEFLSCSGCHRNRDESLGLPGDQKRPPVRFLHIDAVGPDREAKLSEALTDVFLPFRRNLLESFLASAPTRVPAASTAVPLPPDLRRICPSGESGASTTLGAADVARLHAPLATPLGGRRVH